MNNLKSVLDNLKSDKIKDRQEALTSIREVFSQDKVVAKFHINRDGQSNPKVWLPVFQALFTTVIMEKTAATKKTSSKGSTSSATALRRLSEAASLVRWLTERTVHLMNKKVAIALVQHLSQMLSSDRTPDAELFKPVALDYAKALKCIALHTPHLEHLEDYLWVKMVEVSFNAILEDPINTSFAEDEERDAAMDVDSDMYMEDEMQVEDSDVDACNTTPRKGTKRSRRDPTPVPILSPRKSKSKARAKLNVLTSVSLEQVEFASLLSVLLGSPVAPILSSEYPNLASGILIRLQRFLERYPADSSLLHDYLTILSSTLSHLSLNKKHDVEIFARSSWDGLVSLWGTKDKRMKEGLVLVLRHLFEFVICPSFNDNQKLPSFDCADGISRLWHLLSGEAENRWGVDGLRLDSLRLQNIDRTREADERPGLENPFIAKTFRTGWNFDAGQALSWAILELQADCAAKLFQLSESMQDIRSPESATHRENKRIKLENPITSLLNSIQTRNVPHVRSYHLQTLLFFVDRHWTLLHESLKQDVVDVLLQYVAFDDTTVQSWVFLNFAAIAYTEGSRTVQKTTESPTTLDSNTWDSIWTHAVRRANVPAISRAACHAGQTLLTSLYSQTSQTSQISLNSPRVLLEIETLAKDMDIQGPLYPFDSVCIFLSQCLSIARQDSRLYRMHFEDKVLSWFIDSWKLTGGRIKMAPYLTSDILLLLETICSLSKRVDLVFRPSLPESEIVESVVEENKVKIIRDFMLYAKIPAFLHQNDAAASSQKPGRNAANVMKIVATDKTELITPRARERKLSSFFSRTLESLVLEWEGSKDGHSHPTAETARQSLDIAVTATAFESLLVLNGISCNRLVLQNSAKVITVLTQLLTGHHWSLSEKLLVAQGFEPLIYDEGSPEDDLFSEAMSPPGPDSGIKEQTLQRLLLTTRKKKEDLSSERLVLLRLIWQSSDVQDSLQAVITTMRTILAQLLNGKSSNSNSQAMDMDDRDGFGPIRTSLQSSIPNVRQGDNGRPTQHLLRICIGILACGPFLQSRSAEPTRDKELMQLIISSAGDQPEKFRIACPIFFHEVRQGIVSLPIKHLDTFFDEFERLLREYAFSRSERFQRLLLDLLSSSLGVWKSDDTKAEQVHEKFRQLCSWLSKALRTQKIRSWTLRDALARFLDSYLMEDPTQKSWLYEDEAEDDDDYRLGVPTALLPTLNSDPDMRVRFRAAVINARLYSLSEHIQLEPLKLYDFMKQTYTVDVDNYEHMLTRMLSLGNIMVVSSAVRRGPYWHLLETCAHSQEYSNHIEAILTGVSERLGFSSLSVLFDSYAAQLAYSINQTSADFMTFPPHLLGYRDKKQCAEAAFRPFTPTNIITNGRRNFETHCKILGKSIVQGLQDCFGDIAGYYILLNVGDPETSADDLWRKLKDRVKPMDNFESVFQENVDAIVAMLLRSLGEQDFSEGGPVVAALQDFDPSGKTTSIFRPMNAYRAFDTFKAHMPNLPNFSTETILKSLFWVSSRVPDTFTKATTYHVLHELMNAIHHTPLVNEQNRLITALAIWLAYRRQDLEDMTIMRTVIHGATLLLSQSDLARSAQSVLEYCFRYYRAVKPKETHLQSSCLPDVLIRICCIAQEYSNSDDRQLVEMGNGLLTWIDQQLQSFAKLSVFESVLQKALAAWPFAFEHPHKLSPLYNQITMNDLTSVLEDHHITSNKFRLVRRIKQNAADYGDGDNQYSKAYFWRLKECMPPSDRLQDDDVASFAALLYINHGEISSFNPERPDLNAPRLRHRRTFKRRDVGETSAGSRDSKCLIISRDAITLGLLMMLEDIDPLHVSNAYQTLRLIVAISSAGEPQLALPSEYQTEMQHLRAYRRSPVQRPVISDIRETLKSDVYLTSFGDFSQWISLVTILFSDTLAAIDAFFGQITSILASDIAFAEETLPILVQTLLQLEKEKRFPDLSYALHNVLSDYFTVILSSSSADISCIRSIVDIVLHLRYFSHRTSDLLAYNKWLKIDYTLLARSAILCGAYTTALLFIETALEDKCNDDTAIEQVLYEIYAHIDEPDGFYGIKTNDLQHFLIKRFHHEKQWDKAFRFHGAALEAGSSQKGEEEGLLESFHYFGFDHLAIDTLRNSPGQSSDSTTSSSMNYKLGWRTETWDLPDQTKDSSSAPLYRSLRAIYRERDPSILENTIESALLSEMDHLRSLGSENLAEIRSVSQDLMCLGEVLLWRQEDIQNILKPDNMELDKWKDFTKIDPSFTFADLESLMATRISLVRSVRQREERQQLGTFATSFVRKLKNIEKNCLLRLSEAARAADQIQIALNSVVRAQRLDDKPSSEVSEEFANVLWLQKEERLAVRYLQALVDNDDADGKDPIDASRQALWLSRLGTWTSEACLEKPSEISKRYFDPSIELLEKVKETGAFDISLARIYRECAMFAERQYHAILKSPDALRWKVYVDRKRHEIDLRSKDIGSQTDAYKKKKLQNEQARAQKLLTEDSELFGRHNTLRDTLLKQAIDMHSRCLETSSDFDNDSATRFCSLWFANFDDESILDTVKTALARIPSRKLIFLAHQLTARVSISASSVLSPTQENLQSIVIRMCQEHPFHILYQVYCLSDHSSPTTAGRRQSGRHSQSTQTERGTAASNILNRLRIEDTTGQRVQDVERLCDAYLEWAKHAIAGDPRYKTSSRQKDVKFKVPTGLKILGISNLRVPVTTAHTPLDPTLKYDDCVWISGYESTFDTAGGVNLPKISICLGSDGQKYKQLFKGEGNDDLRQDAVMEQVFDLVNNMLKHDRETRRRDLKVRDYKVIPLASQAGILEFVGNTAPLKEWLYKKHPAYRPHDLKPHEAAVEIQKTQLNFPGNQEKQVETFLKMRARFKPVMRHYFTEKHKNPITWFQMRLHYTRSVATTSIVGHILGLGDRHTSNILLDNVSGEVVHIDLGIAFDQGKLLGVPERVPFRMTADIVDGMGPSGTSGVFQRCAEETLRVLRDESEVIMTVLEVFKHDPLHSWTASEVKVKQAQSDAPTTTTTSVVADTAAAANPFIKGIGIDMSSGSADEAADRALSSVARKLDKALSVESTVNELLAEATDVVNLATIFYGWGAHI